MTSRLYSRARAHVALVLRLSDQDAELWESITPREFRDTDPGYVFFLVTGFSVYAVAYDCMTEQPPDLLHHGNRRKPRRPAKENRGRSWGHSRQAARWWPGNNEALPATPSTLAAPRV